MNQEEINKEMLKELFEAIENNNIEKVKNLVENGADINAEYNYESQAYNELEGLCCRFMHVTILAIASINGHLEIVRYLVEHGADVNKNDNGYTVLKEASRYGKLGVVKYLVENGAKDINDALISASEEGYLEIVKYLSEHVEDINAKNKALMIASSCGKLGVVKCLVENGADINAKDKNGKTALIYAVEKRKLRIVEYLIENGIDINAKYDYYHNSSIYYKGVTILMIATIIFREYNKYKIKTLEIFKYLIKKGADVNIENDRCNTALDFTIDEEVIKILIEAGAK